MRDLTWRRALGLAAWAVTGVVVVLGLLFLGTTIPTRPVVALAAAGSVLVLGLSALRPVFLPLVAMPCAVLVVRVPAVPGGISAADVATFAAVWPALFLATKRYTEPMRAIIWLVVVYQCATLFAVVANPYAANVIDWWHTLFLVAGSLVVGWAVAREGYARTGMTLLLLVAAALAVATLAQGLLQIAGGDLTPVRVEWPFPMHKNFVGTTLAAVAVIMYARPRWMGWSVRWSNALLAASILGVLMTQSRQGLIGLGAAFVYVVLRTGQDRRRSKLILVTIPPTLAIIVFTVMQQFASGNRFNSSQQRLDWFRDSIDIWLHSPWFGVGLRWWYTARFDTQFQPPNAELEVLTTAGVVGLAGFLVLVLGTLRVLSRLDPTYGTLAVAVVFNRFVQGQFDLFWASVGASVPFLIAGICLGAQAHRDEVLEPPPPEPPRHAKEETDALDRADLA